jgi:hypothetical protein
MSSHSTAGGRTQFRQNLIEILESKVDSILSLSRPSGQFGTEPWIVRDQDVMLTLALLYTCEGSEHFKSPELLETIAAGGRHLRDQQDEKGMYLFNKKDGSEWGMIYMPWTYLKWIVTFDLIGEDLSVEDKAVWEEGLLLGYSGISETELSSQSNIYPGTLPGQPELKEGEVAPWLHNIPSHHAVGLYLAGQVFNRPEWQKQADEYFQLIVDFQSEDGWWTEHSGPVVLYNRVYLEALALYYHFSNDGSVFEALKRGNLFHLNYTYPNGAAIETVDERNVYYPVKVSKKAGESGEKIYLPKHATIHPGLYFTDEGRALLDHQLRILNDLRKDELEAEFAEYMYLCLPEDEDALDFTTKMSPRFRMGKDSLIVRESSWIISLSGYSCERTGNRFIQDRQNLVSLYHDKSGLILGGGNTKLQPLWSTMTVGDVSLLTPIGAPHTHATGTNEDTGLAPDVDLGYFPNEIEVLEAGESSCGLRIQTLDAVSVITVEIVSENEVKIKTRLEKASSSGKEVANHLTFIRYPESPVLLSDGTEEELGDEAFSKKSVEWMKHHNWKLKLPSSSKITWPVLPHNPYARHGHAESEEGRLVVSLPLDGEGDEKEVILTIGD